MSGIRAKNNLVMYCGSKGFTGVMIVYDFGICIDIQNRGEGNVKVMLLPDAMKGLLQRAEAVAVRLHFIGEPVEIYLKSVYVCSSFIAQEISPAIITVSSSVTSVFQFFVSLST